MLLQHGDFRGVEVQLTKESEQLAQNDTKGGWYSEQAMAQEGYTEYHGNQYHQECIRARYFACTCHSVCMQHLRSKYHDQELDPLGHGSWSYANQ